MPQTLEHPLAHWLNAVGKTPGEFARELNVTTSYLSHVLSGRRKPRQLLYRISEKTTIPFDRLNDWEAA